MTEEKTQAAESQKSSDTITIKKDQLWKYSTFVLAAIVLVGAIAIFAGDNGGTPTGAVVGANPGTAPPAVKADLKLEDDDHFLFGTSDAEVQIIEYSDFECPFCGRLYSDAGSQIKAKYGDNPKVAFAYRHLPLSFHPQARPAALAAECAAEQGKFVEMHDMLFESGVQGGATSFKAYASQLGLDTSKFDSCLDTEKYANEVDADLASAQANGARGTPATFINGISVSGAQPFSAFQQVIDAELN